MKHCKKNIASIIVTYQPDLDALGRGLRALKPQVDVVIVVDNGSSNLKDLKQVLKPFDARLESLTANTGIAHAQNVGISLARHLSASYVLLMDQDSVPDANMVCCLKREIDILKEAGAFVAAVGPRYTDVRYTEFACFNRVEGVRVKRLGCKDGENVVEVDYLIASGSLIPIEVIDHVGGMAENLFIDYTDIEWGLRAKYAGFVNYGVCEARLDHSLGENPIRFFGRRISVHSPVRNYYFVRNALLMYRKPHVPWNWIVADLGNVLKLMVKSCIVGPQRWLRLRYIIIGLWHGLSHRAGPIPTRWLARS